MNEVASTPTSSAPPDGAALAWVLEQVRDNLLSALAVVRRQAQEVQGGASSPGALAQARDPVHQAGGALQMLEQHACAQILRTAERVLERALEQPRRLDGAMVEALEAALHAVLDYLEARAAGRDEAAVKLFRQYRALADLAGGESAHPADLWDHPWEWPQPPDQEAGDGGVPRVLGTQARSDYERALLEVLRAGDMRTASATMQQVARQAQHACQGAERALWWIAEAFLCALGEGFIEPDIYVKRLCNRLNLHLRQMLAGNAQASRRLAHELLFFCDQALAVAAARERAAPPALQQVADALALHPHAVVDWQQPHFGLVDPALVQQARKRMLQVKEGWTQIGNGDFSRISRLQENLQQLGLLLRQLCAGAEILTAAVERMVQLIGQQRSMLTPERVLEVATALLFLEASLGHFRADDAEFLPRARELAQRLQRSAQGYASEAFAPWMEQLYRKVSETQTLGTVVQELRHDMGTVERLLDAFFRDPGTLPELEPVPRLLGQMRGVLSVLGMDVGAQALGHIRQSVENLMAAAPGDAQRQADAFERLAANIGALGLLVDMLGYQPELARISFQYDPHSAELRPVVPPARSAARPRPHAPIEAASTADAPTAPPAMDSGSEPAKGLGLVPAPTPATAWSAPTPSMPAQVPLEEADTLTPAPEVDAAPSPPAPAPGEEPPATATDPELLEIFLDEADEVIASGRHRLEDLRGVDPADDSLTALRRCFHTLKGSSRMVGMSDFAEAAWSLEQLFNQVLAESVRAPHELLDLAARAFDELHSWVQDLRRAAPGGHSSAALVQAAQAMRQRQNPPAAEPAAPKVAAEDLHEATPLPAGLPAFELPVDDLPATELPILELPAAEPPAAEPPATEPPATEWPDLAAPAAEPPAVLLPAALAEPEIEPSATPEEGPSSSEPQPEAAPLPLPADWPDASLLDLGAPVEPVEAVEPVEPVESVESVEAVEPVAPVGEASSQQAAAVTEPLHVEELHIPQALQTIYLNEADELVRRLDHLLSEWSSRSDLPLGDEAMALAHQLRGSSATVGLRSVQQLADDLEQVIALQVRQPTPWSDEERARLPQAVEEARRLLHQFAAGFVQPARAEILEGLRALLERLRGLAHAPVAQAPEAQEALDEERALPTVPALQSAWSWTPPPAVLPEAAAEPPQPPLEETPPEPAQLLDLELEIEESAPQPPPPPAPQAEPAPPEATELGDSIDTELFPIFEFEAAELLPQLAAALRQWESRPSDASAPRQAMRLLHTFKGSARMAGTMALGDMAHALESDIEALLGSETGAPNEQALGELATRFDAINTRFERLREASTRGETELGDIHPERALLEALASQEQDDTPPPVVETAAPPQSPEVTRVVGRSQPVRVQAALLDRLVNQVGEVSIARARLDSEFDGIRGGVRDLGDNLARLRAQVRDIELQADAQMAARTQATRDDGRDFDPLEFDRFTRFQELTRMMAESIDDLALVQGSLGRALQSAEDSLARQTRLTRELQRDLLRTRLVEFDSISERLYRTVRQASKDAGKAVRLDIQGGTIEIDRGVLDRMAPAFEHLLRNAVAHGLESPAEREIAGKPAVGTIVLALRHEGSEVAVSISDDGAGLRYSDIAAKAREQGLLAEGEQATQAQLREMIFRAGFSSAAQTTEIAGRGVGLDVVRNDTRALGGRVELESTPGRGTTFTLVLPLTTAVTQVVLLRVGQRVHAVPSSLVDLVLRLRPAELEAALRQQWLEHGGQQLPLYWLGALTDESTASSETVGRTLPVVLVRSAAQRLALHVDEVLGNQEVVVKNLGPQLSRVPGLAGISVLPSGGVVLIYNPVALAAVYGEQAAERMRHQAGSSPVEQPVVAPPQAVLPSANTVLVVDDSITVRRVTQRFLARNGYSVMLAKDGLDALEQLQQQLPDVVLTDIEMPRMDGFDLTRNIRADERTRHLPVIMITSRIADKHRNYAQELGVNHYLGKPYSEEELLGLLREYVLESADD